MDGPGWRHPARPCCCPSGSAPPGSNPGTSGGWRRWSRWRWPMRPRRPPAWPDGTIRLKWPNDLVVETRTAPQARKLAGVLGETDGPRDRRPARRRRPGDQCGLARRRLPAGPRPSMTSLREAAGGGPIDATQLLAAFLETTSSRDRRRCATGRFDGTRLDGPPGDDRPDRPPGDARTASKPFERSGSTRHRRAHRRRSRRPGRRDATSSSARSATSAWPIASRGRV